ATAPAAAAALTLPTAACAPRGTAATVGGRRGVSKPVDLIRVDLLIADAVAVLVEISHRLLKQARLRISLGNGPFGDIEPVFAHADVDDRAQLVRVVGPLPLDPLAAPVVRPEPARQVR